MGIAGSASAFAGTVQSGIVPNCSHRIGAVTRPQAAEMPTTSTTFPGTGYPSCHRRRRGIVRKIAATAANESWNPGSRSDRGVQASSTTAPIAIVCQRSLGRESSHATEARQPATAARTTDGCQPTARAYARIATIASVWPTVRPSPATYASPSTPKPIRRDVLPRHREQVVEPRRLERGAEIGIDALVGSEHDADDERPPLARGSERESIADRRAQPVADATNPAPPADDVPGAARVQDDVNAAPLEPPSLVESGLGPSRGDRARPELEHGALGRGASGRELEQHPLSHVEAIEPVHVGHHPHREARPAGRAGDDDPCGCGVADSRGEVAPVELVEPETAPPQPSGAQSDPGEGEPHVLRQPARAATSARPATAAAGQGTAIQFAAASPAATAPSATAGQPRSSAS